MSKELKAFKRIWALFDFKDMQYERSLVIKALTPPTVDEVCKALSEQLKTPIKTGKNKHGVTFNYVNTGKTFISLNYNLINITVKLPHHLMTMIGKFYESLEEIK